MFCYSVHRFMDWFGGIGNIKGSVLNFKQKFSFDKGLFLFISFSIIC